MAKDLNHEPRSPSMKSWREDGGSDEESSSLRTRMERKWGSPRHSQWGWKITTFVSAFLAAATLIYALLIIRRDGQSGRYGSFERGFSTDFALMLPHIAAQVKRPDMGSTLYPNGTVESTPSPYIGMPGPDIDQVWGQLLRGNEMVLDDDEVGVLKGKTMQEKDGRWRLSVGVYHGLHCLNLVRKGLDLDYYSNENLKRVHIGKFLMSLLIVFLCLP
jgi:hypothetical protein